MGLFDGLIGNASKITVGEIEKDFEDLFSPSEIVEAGYKLVRDLIIFTNKRLILIDKQGLTGKKTEYMSIPYKSITYFSVETAGHFDLDAELKIYVSGRALPIEKQFNKNTNIYEVQSILADHIG
ncbi:MAG: PH domain-containing protein [Clostridium sp.]|uniref:PH domain-containing protein n=1 Tax=Clostridium sp. TaxID=1506 RepID=UPI002FCC8468